MQPKRKWNASCSAPCLVKNPSTHLAIGGIAEQLSIGALYAPPIGSRLLRVSVHGQYSRETCSGKKLSLSARVPFGANAARGDRTACLPGPSGLWSSSHGPTIRRFADDLYSVTVVGPGAGSRLSHHGDDLSDHIDEAAEDPGPYVAWKTDGEVEGTRTSCAGSIFPPFPSYNSPMTTAMTSFSFCSTCRRRYSRYLGGEELAE